MALPATLEVTVRASNDDGEVQAIFLALIHLKKEAISKAFLPIDSHVAILALTFIQTCESDLIRHVRDVISNMVSASWMIVIQLVPIVTAE